MKARIQSIGDNKYDVYVMCGLKLDQANKLAEDISNGKEINKGTAKKKKAKNR